MSESNGNPWGISFSQGLFNMTSDSRLFLDQPATDTLPLYEAKMIHQFDHRWATYGVNGERGMVSGEWRMGNGGDADRSSHTADSRDVTDEEKANPRFTVTPRYWVRTDEVEQRLKDKGWTRGWLMGWRDITNATNERTVIASVVPRVGTGDTLLLMFPDPKHGVRMGCVSRAYWPINAR